MRAWPTYLGQVVGIHVNIGEAKDRLSQLIAAAERGEEVVIARNGSPVVRLQAVEPTLSRAEKRRLAFGKYKSGLSEEEINRVLLAPMTEEELALWYDAPISSDADS